MCMQGITSYLVTNNLIFVQHIKRVRVRGAYDVVVVDACVVQGMFG